MKLVFINLNDLAKKQNKKLTVRSCLTHHDVALEQLGWLEHKVELVCLSCINMAAEDTNAHYSVYLILKYLESLLCDLM